MKIDRLIGILAILLQQDQVTAPYLAGHFEVSRRTINRDIEDICKAGIPIVTERGRNGGISIMEGYRIDRALLSSGDMRAIVAGLRSLDSVSSSRKYQQLMEKLSAGGSDVLRSNSHIMIDLSSWHRASLAPKIELIQQAIEDRKKIRFRYHSPKGETRREIEPYLLIFQWSSWYVWGYCGQREDFRLFKLERMVEVEETENCFEARQFPLPDLSPEHVFPPSLQATALFEPALKWRLVEAYGVDGFTERPDGKLLISASFMDQVSLFSWLLDFGDQVELLEPPELREEYRGIISRILKKYYN